MWAQKNSLPSTPNLFKYRPALPLRPTKIFPRHTGATAVRVQHAAVVFCGEQRFASSAGVLLKLRRTHHALPGVRYAQCWTRHPSRGAEHTA